MEKNYKNSEVSFWSKKQKIILLSLSFLIAVLAINRFMINKKIEKFGIEKGQIWRETVYQNTKTGEETLMVNNIVIDIDAKHVYYLHGEKDTFLYYSDFYTFKYNSVRIK
jgi:hypothetical protein